MKGGGVVEDLIVEKDRWIVQIDGHRVPLFTDRSPGTRPVGEAYDCLIRALPPTG